MFQLDFACESASVLSMSVCCVFSAHRIVASDNRLQQTKQKRDIVIHIKTIRYNIIIYSLDSIVSGFCVVVWFSRIKFACKSLPALTHRRSHVPESSIMFLFFRFTSFDFARSYLTQSASLGFGLVSSVCALCCLVVDIQWRWLLQLWLSFENTNARKHLNIRENDDANNIRGETYNQIECWIEQRAERDRERERKR